MLVASLCVCVTLSMYFALAISGPFASVGIVVEKPLADVYMAGHAGVYRNSNQAYAGSVNNYPTRHLFDDLANGEHSVQGGAEGPRET